MTEQEKQHISNMPNEHREYLIGEFESFVKSIKLGKKAATNPEPKEWGEDLCLNIGSASCMTWFFMPMLPSIEEKLADILINICNEYVEKIKELK